METSRAIGNETHHGQPRSFETQLQVNDGYLFLGIADGNSPLASLISTLQSVIVLRNHSMVVAAGSSRSM